MHSPTSSTPTGVQSTPFGHRNEYSALEAWALAYAAAGYAVLPLNGKVPRIRNGKDAATTDADQLRAWWRRWPDANIGLRVPDDAVVLDVDTPDGHASDADGFATLAELEDAHGVLPPAPASISGGGGRHLWFRSEAAGDIGNRAGELNGRGIDVRGGGNGYIVAPPSVHPDTGRRYEWAGGWSLLDLDRPELPDWTVGLLRGGKRRRSSSTKIRGGYSGGVIDWSGISEHSPAASWPSALGKLRERGEKLCEAEGSRHDRVFKLATRAGELIGAGLLTLEDARAIVERFASDVFAGEADRIAAEERTARDGIARGLESALDARGEATGVQVVTALASGPYMDADAPFAPAATVLHADLGSGKTERIARQSAGRERVLLVAHRRSLVAGLAERCGVHWYEGTDGPIHEERVAVCIESLPRIAAATDEDGRFLPWDLVVIEESEATLKQLIAGEGLRGAAGRASGPELYERLRAICASTVKGGGSVVFADADASELTAAGARALCGVEAEALRWERHRRPLRRTLIEYPRREDLLAEILDAIREERRIVVACTTKADARMIAHLARSIRPEARVLAYHADTPEEERETLRDPATTWAEADVVVYSPTVDAGVSYADPAPAFDAVFVLARFVGGVGINAVFQQAIRVRHAETPIHAWVQDRGASDEDLTLDGIREELEERARLTREAAPGRVDARVWTPGRRVVERDGEFYEEAEAEHFKLACVVERLARIRGERWSDHLQRWAADQAMNYQKAEPADDAVVKLTRDIVSRASEEAACERASAILAAPELTTEEWERWRRSGRRWKTLDELHTLERARLEDTFSAALVQRECETLAARKGEELAKLDDGGRRSAAVRHWAGVGCVLDGAAECVGRDDDRAARTGYRGAMRASRATHRAVAVVLLAAFGDDTRRLFLPPGADPADPDAGGMMRGETPCGRWDQDRAASEQWGPRALAALRREGLASRAALRGSGVRLEDFDTPAGCVRAVGAALRWCGLTSDSHREGGGARSYTINARDWLRTRAEGANTRARMLGYDVRPLAVRSNPTPWRVAVTPDGSRWMPPAERHIDVEPLTSKTADTAGSTPAPHPIHGGSVLVDSGVWIGTSRHPDDPPDIREEAAAVLALLATGGDAARAVLAPLNLDLAAVGAVALGEHPPDVLELNGFPGERVFEAGDWLREAFGGRHDA